MLRGVTKFLRNTAETDSCIVTVGSTGTGKSSTIKLYTLQDVKVSGGANSETAKCALFTNKRNPRLPAWLDTVGWDDTGGKDDILSFQDFLHFINDNSITNVQAIVWTVTANIRRDAKLQKQAEFIDQICPGKIWNNVVIIAKAGMSAENDCQGALEAVRLKYRHARIRCLAYRYLQDQSLDKTLRDRLSNDLELRKSMKMVTDEEAYHLLKEKLDTITKPVQVIFKNKRCVDCGVFGDERLLSKYCHMKKIMVYNGHFERYHPKKRKEYHLLNQGGIHPGKVETRGGYDEDWVLADNIVKLIPIVNIVGGIITEIGKAATYTDIEHRFTCCKRPLGDPGCETIWECCKKEKSNPGCRERYDCCFSDGEAKGCERRYKCCTRDEGAIGCVAICINCNALWGTSSGECYIKRHNLVKT